mgnify:CR=1 FL=1
MTIGTGPWTRLVPSLPSLLDRYGSAAALRAALTLAAAPVPRWLAPHASPAPAPLLDGVLGPFLRPTPSRWSDGTVGVWYGADTLPTAQAEVAHHRTAFLRRTHATAATLPHRIVHATLAAGVRLDDLRALSRTDPRLDPVDYAPSRTYGLAQARARSVGLCWPSVRLVRAAACCIGVFDPQAISDVAIDAGDVVLRWDGVRGDWG